MITVAGNTNPIQNTTHKVVLPFYVFASVSFFLSVVLLLFSTDAFTTHHFHPHTLAITYLRGLQAGAHVNLEVDMVARYLERLVAIPMSQNFT